MQIQPAAFTLTLMTRPSSWVADLRLTSITSVSHTLKLFSQNELKESSVDIEAEHRTVLTTCRHLPIRSKAAVMLSASLFDPDPQTEMNWEAREEGDMTINIALR